MRRVSLNWLKPGEKLARPICEANGQVLLNSGVTLTRDYVKALRRRGITHVFVDDRIFRDVIVEDLVRSETRKHATKTIKRAFKRVQSQGVEAVNPEEIARSIDLMIEEIIKKPDISYSLIDIKSTDDYTFEHSVCVCILSLVMGRTLNYSEKQLQALGMGAILHDLGKMNVPYYILNKPGKLGPEELDIVKKHPVDGHRLLRSRMDFHTIVPEIAYCHHERWDGTGYPRGLKGKEIPEYGRLVSLADVYDALTSDRPYRQKMLPHEACEIIMAEADRQFDREMVETFLYSVAAYPNGTIVELNTKERGVVSGQNLRFPFRPVVKVWDQKNKQTYTRNLLKETTVFVTRILDELPNFGQTS